MKNDRPGRPVRRREQVGNRFGLWDRDRPDLVLGPIEPEVLALDGQRTSHGVILPDASEDGGTQVYSQGSMSDSAGRARSRTPAHGSRDGHSCRPRPD